MALGCFLAGASFLVMVLAAHGTGPEERRSIAWLVGTVFILTIGELYLSPIGLSLVTKVAPARIVSMMMGIWFLSSFFGNYFSGFLGTFWERMPNEVFPYADGTGLGAGVTIWCWGARFERKSQKMTEAASKAGIDLVPGIHMSYLASFTLTAYGNPHIRH